MKTLRRYDKELTSGIARPEFRSLKNGRRGREISYNRRDNPATRNAMKQRPALNPVDEVSADLMELELEQPSQVRPNPDSNPPQFVANAALRFRPLEQLGHAGYPHWGLNE